ncbi:MAG: hypothetical protein U0L77_09165, partial [Prevotellamassilia sp.]|nr:hypothetical protein [Prevotellamassilia sp.]
CLLACLLTFYSTWANKSWLDLGYFQNFLSAKIEYSLTKPKDFEREFQREHPTLTLFKIKHIFTTEKCLIFHRAPTLNFNILFTPKIVSNLL